MYRIPCVRVQLVRESTQQAIVRTINNPADVFTIIRELMEFQDREIFAILLLNTRNKVLGINVVSIGSLNTSIVHPREVFKPAILANSAAIILAHNHPSGDPSPSKEDIAISSRLREVGELLGISVLDHVIIGDGNFISLKERGLI